jgi:hypothetical protein
MPHPIILCGFLGHLTVQLWNLTIDRGACVRASEREHRQRVFAEAFTQGIIDRSPWKVDRAARAQWPDSWDSTELYSTEL